MAHAVLDKFEREGQCWGSQAAATGNNAQQTAHVEFTPAAADTAALAPPAGRWRAVACGTVPVAGSLTCGPHRICPQPVPFAPLSFAGLFIGAEQGTELLQLAVRRDVGDLSVAHRIYDRMTSMRR